MKGGSGAPLFVFWGGGMKDSPKEKKDDLSRMYLLAKKDDILQRKTTFFAKEDEIFAKEDDSFSKGSWPLRKEDFFAKEDNLF